MPIWMYFVLFFYVKACFFLIFVILVQSGKGGGLSSLAGASSGLQEALGSTAGERTLNRLTYGAAGAFVVLAVILALGGQSMHSDGGPLLPEAAPVNAPLTPGVGDLAADPVVPNTETAPTASESTVPAAAAPGAIESAPPAGAEGIPPQAPENSIPSEPVPAQ